MLGQTNARPSRILVVDDNDANRALAKAALEDEGYAVILATGGAAAVESFVRDTPDCILLDVRMPDVDGFAACARIRTMSGGPETPIIFLTALRDVDTFDQALSAGGDDFLTKPVRPAELVARVQTALKLRRMRAELGEHYELLKHQRDALQRLQLQKERLTTFLVHDLKNPVGTMDLHAQILLRDPSLSDGAREAVLQIRTEARRLDRMILNLLDLSKGDEGKLTPRTADLDLRALLTELTAELSATSEARKVRIETSVGVDRVRADPDLLRRVVVNLVENAVRYAPTGTAVTFTAALTGGSVELSVSDAGVGIPKELRERVFDPFVQVEGGSAPMVARTSRGLGLAFCKVAVEAHGGTIWVEDAAPGAVFKVRLPQ